MIVVMTGNKLNFVSFVIHPWVGQLKRVLLVGLLGKRLELWPEQTSRWRCSIGNIFHVEALRCGMSDACVVRQEKLLKNSSTVIVAPAGAIRTVYYFFPLYLLGST